MESKDFPPPPPPELLAIDTDDLTHGGENAPAGFGEISAQTGDEASNGSLKDVLERNWPNDSVPTGGMYYLVISIVFTAVSTVFLVWEARLHP